MMMRLLISAMVLLGAQASFDQAGADGREENILRLLQTKRIMRCPTATGCGQQVSPEDFNVTVAFSSGSARLDGEAKRNIRRFALRYLAHTPDARPVTVAGYTDGQGDEDYNYRLAARRGNAVRRVLIQTYRLPAGSIELQARGVRTTGSKAATREDRIVAISVAGGPARSP